MTEVCRLWVNPERTVLVRQWATGAVEVCHRESPSHTWGPPIEMVEERTFGTEVIT